MIDIHCHILPGIDDGPKDMKTAVKMARIAAKDGIETVVATPHCFDGVYNCQSVDIVALCANFNERLCQDNINLTVLPGAEIRMVPGVVELVDRGEAASLGGFVGTLLFELPEVFIPEGVEKTINMLRKRGVRCIIAHPERNSFLFSRKEVVTGLVFAGAELQIDGGSLLGEFGRAVRSFARQLLQVEGCCFLGSDGHDIKRRKPVLARAVRCAARIVGKDAAEGLVRGF